MSKDYDQDMQGSLFPNDKKKTVRSPDLTGYVIIKNKRYKLSAFKKEYGNGKKRLWMIANDPDSYNKDNPNNTRRPSRNDDEDDAFNFE